MRALALALLLAATALPAAAQTPTAEPAVRPEPLIRKTSPHTVSETVDRLAAAVEAAGATVFARINHAEGAAKAGLTLPPTTVLVFGNPKIGTPMMLANGAMGLELPLRVVVYEDGEGPVQVVYRNVRLLAAEYGVAVPAVAAAAGALDKLTDAAIAAD